MVVDYKEEKFVKVRVCGIECDFSDMRIDRTTVVHGKYQYEIAGDDDRGDEPVRIGYGVLVNFFGTLVSDVALPLGDGNILWLQEGDFEWL